MIPFPDKKYSVIYADPPWSYSGGGAARNVAKHYHTMKPEDIYSLPVQNIAADDCLLFLWATFPNLDVALETIRRWGFRYKTAAFVCPFCCAELARTEAGIPRACPECGQPIERKKKP